MSGGDGWELLERDAELAAIEGVVEAARGGSGGTLLIEGEAGVGKTALLDHACRAATDRGMTVLQARGGELERGFTWGLVRQLFEFSLARSDAGDRARLLAGSAALASPVFSLSSGGGGTADESFATLHGLYWMAVNLTQDAPVLLAIDDLQWADQPSLRFLSYLAPRVDGVPIGLVATSRPIGSEPASDPDLLARIATDSAMRHCRPAALSLQACTALVRARLSSDADGELCLACHEMSQGNPFLLGALLDSLRAEDLPLGEGTAHVRRMTPDAVARSVLVRLIGLPTGADALARAIAVLGPKAEFRQVRQLAGLEIEIAVAGLAALSRAGIIRGEAAVEFVHPLVRSAVLGDLTPAERGRWHKRAADLQIADRRPAQEVAPHLLESLPDGDAQTVDVLRRAAAQARAQGAPELAVDYLRRALAEPPASEVRAGVLLELGAAEAVQSPEDGVAHLREAMAASSDPEQQARISLTLGDALAASGRLGESLSVLRTGMSVVPTSDGELHAHLEALLIATARWEPQAQQLRHEAVAALHDRAGAHDGLDPLLHAQLALEIAAGGSERDAAIHHARQVLRSAPERTLGASTVPEVTLVLTFAGLPEEAWQANQTTLARAQRLGWPLGIATSSTCAALTALHLGWISEAVAAARGAMTPGSGVQFGPISLAFLIEALIERGATAVACDELAQRGFSGELPLIWPTTPLLLARGRLRAALGDHAGAIADLRQVGERVATWGLSNPAMTPWRSSLAGSLVALGERDEALALAEEELRAAERWGTARAIGIALRAVGLAQEGPESLAQACEVLEMASAPVEHGRSLYELGAALRRRGSRTEARHKLELSLDVAHRHGAFGLAEKARQELLILGARPRRDALRGRDSLTSSELRVAQLAAEGRTNNEIAQLLFVTPRTVETHLTSSYAKLGIRSRRSLDDALRQTGS